MVFEPKRHLIKVQGGKMYLPVAARLIWFRNEHPDWGIETEPFAIDVERQYAIFRCTIRNEAGQIMAQDTKYEDVRGFPDYIEKASTGAVGRALALCGFGTQFAPELNEVDAGRFADSPQSMRQPQNQGRGGNRQAPAPMRPSMPSGQPASPNVNQDAPLQLVHVAGESDSAPTATPACGKCSKPLTRSQQELSVRHYGEALCPSCQKMSERLPMPADANGGAH